MGLERGDRVGPYRIRSSLGRGGSGQVFTATDDATGSRVAIKVLRPEVAHDPESVARFRQEGRVLAELRHRRIVEVYASETLEDGTAYMAMEYLEGSSLHDWMARQRSRVELATALSIGEQIADAMVEAHARGFVHRDLKPGNVMLVSSDTAPGSAPDIKVVDFGIAKVSPELLKAGNETEEAKTLGTPLYRAPEQWGDARKATPKADVYSLGVMLYEMLADRPPYEAQELIELRRMHGDEEVEPPPLKDSRIEAPHDLIVLVRAMLAEKPSKRPTMARCRSRLAKLRSDIRNKCPFPGLQAFTEDEAELFFGREEEIEDVLERLNEARADKHRWVHIEGLSGTGKSSLVQAGVLPRLEDGGSLSSQWMVARMRPSKDPIRSLAQAMFDALSGPDFQQSMEQIESSLRGNPDALRALCAHTPSGYTLLLVIDQLEDLFTLSIEQVVSSFEALLCTALAAPESPLRLLTTMRSDFHHRLVQMPTLARLLTESSRVYLRPMTGDALRQVVHGMPRLAEMVLPEDLPGRMVSDALSTACPLPLLGHALRALWSPKGATPTELGKRYREAGIIDSALADRAEQLLTSLGDKDQERAKWIILSLTQAGRGVADTRRSRTRGEVLTAAGGDSSANDVLLRLSGARFNDSPDAPEGLRLIVLSDESAEDPSQQRVDLIHETLLHAVPLIKEWVTKERSRLERYDDLEYEARVWEQTGYPVDGLPSGAMLEHYRGDPRDGQRSQLLMRMVSERARRFLKAAERLERRRRRGKQAVMSLILAVVAAIFYAFWQQQIAESNLQSFIYISEQLDQYWKLRRTPGTIEVRRDMLTRIDKALLSLPRQVREKPEVSERIIETKHHLGDLALTDGLLETANIYFLQAHDELDRNLDGPTTKQPRKKLFALNESELGKVALARGQLQIAQHHFKRALELLEEIPPNIITDKEDFDRTLATSYFEQAEMELAITPPNYAEAARCYDETIRLLNPLEGNYNKSLLAEALTAKAALIRRSGDLQDAAALLDRAMTVQSRLTDPVFADAHSRLIWARGYIEAAALAAKQLRYDSAAKDCQEAYSLAEALLKGDPTRKPYALVLAESLVITEAVALAQANDAKAKKARQELNNLVDEFGRRDPGDKRFQRFALASRLPP